MAKNRKCQCCGTKYTYCPSCSGADKLKPNWYTQFCSEECMTIWTTAVKLNMKLINKSEAKSAIKAIELKDRSEYVACIQRDLDNILKEDEIVHEDIVTVEESIVEPTTPLLEEEVLVEVEEPVEMEEVEQPLSYKRNRKNRQKSHAVVKEENE